MALVLDIADAVVYAINHAPSGTLVYGSPARAISAARKILPVFDLDEMGTLHVTVIPHAPQCMASEQASRGERQKDVSIDIGVQKIADSDADADVLISLAEAIDEYMSRADIALTGGRAASLLTSTVAASYLPDHLSQKARQVTAVVSLVYRVVE